MAAKMEVPFFRPHIGAEERQEILEVLDSGWLTTGPRCQRFEKDMCAYLGRAQAVAVNSGTAALHLALAVSGVKPGQGMIVPTHTFAATAEVAFLQRALPILAETDPITHNLDLDWLEALLADPGRHPLARRSKQPLPPISAVMPVHYGGLMVDMDRLAGLARQYKLIVIEDAAHTLGAFRPGRDGSAVRVGDLSQSACLSFYPNKGITTGEGGMVVTDDVQTAERMRVLRLHGLDSQAWRRYAQGGSWYTEVLEAGFKYNLTDIAAALGLHQLKRADWLLARRRQIAGRYRELLEGLAGLRLPNGPEALAAMGGQGVLEGHSWFLYPVQLTAESPVSRDTFIKDLAGRGISCAVHWVPLHLHPFYRQMGYAPGDFPKAEAGFDGLVSLPFFTDLTEDQISYVAENIKQILAGRP